MQMLTHIRRALALRCPRCGQGKLFRGWFTMYERCSHCDLLFQREPGYFLGSIYFNYGITASVVTVTYFALFFTTDIPPRVLLWSLVAYCFVFPLWFFRYARALWMGCDEWLDSRSEDPSKR